MKSLNSPRLLLFLSLTLLVSMLLIFVLTPKWNFNEKAARKNEIDLLDSLEKVVKDSGRYSRVEAGIYQFDTSAVSSEEGDIFDRILHPELERVEKNLICGSAMNLAKQRSEIVEITSKDDSQYGERRQIKKSLNSGLKYPWVAKIGPSILVSAASFMPYSSAQIDGHKFHIVVRGDSDTVYIATKDMDFRTPEGYHIGMPFSNIPHELRTETQKEPGWGYYVKLGSGWNLGFCEGNSCTDEFPHKNSRVKWIFKRK